MSFKVKEKKNEPRVRVIFHGQDARGGDEDIFVSLNGRAFVIKREHEVELPEDVLRVIEGAEQTLFESGDGGAGRPRKVKRYSFTRLSGGGQE